MKLKYLIRFVPAAEASLKYQVICSLSTHPSNLALYASFPTSLVKYSDIQKQLVRAHSEKQFSYILMRLNDLCNAWPKQFLKMKIWLNCFYSAEKIMKKLPSFLYITIIREKLKHSVFSLITNLLQIDYY